ncbi:lysophospholipid acyltransferase family protein [Thermosyntropha sp.]|uniref:lysophospholipid acyltransferase family protein n=1 Tax=Thermosyntropha sp. TaxID=2740820 RepID=UPI0025D66325|nr:lysophospholipid acyltransferase family protein [Thermosyntropha sp.]MBO8159548.1 1-acyl-sn-glycerol-3-phosphate acyltransferase [Thermosyntropha sp.]
MFYRFAWFIMRTFFTLLGLRMENVHNLPEKGAAIVVANHVSNWDPIVVAISFKRPIYFMAKAELFENSFLARILTMLNAFPVKRGSADRAAIKNALKVLEKGQILGIFPEGQRNKTGEDLEAQSGAAMLALKTGVPVVPVACIGTDRKLPIGWLKPLKVKVGKPMFLEEFKGQKINSLMLKEVSEQIMYEINLLLQK